MNKKHLIEFLKTTGIQELRTFDSIGSTNDEALDWIDQGAPDFALVIADHQTKGRGRFDRRWITEPGSSLAFSLILIPTIQEKTNLPLFAPLCGLAIHDAFLSLLHLDSEIKWPNDILIDGKKCSGILVEAAWMDNEINGIVLGIGINISAESVPPLDLQLFPPTCLENRFKNPIDRYQVLQEVLKFIQIWRPLIGSKRFFSEWQRHLAFKNQNVMIMHSKKQSIIGIEKGIDEQGRLVLILEENQERAFEVGDVHLRPADQSLIGGKHA
ncbi:MAG: biotin--[acetyl-CoA-carboxylase] ligase [Chloroflexi bacterium]|nr:biotin--[acetyl-CoA-carboxylase] ligase [Chloroflexota bacterium]